MKANGFLPVLLGLGAAVLVFAGLWAAASLMAPLTVALFIITSVVPWQRQLERILPRPLAMVLMLLAIVAVVGAFGSLAVWAVSRAGQWLVENSASILALYAATTAMLDAQGLDTAAALAGQLDVSMMLRTARSLAAYLQGFVNFTMLMLIFIILGLPEAGPAARRLAALGPDGHGGLALRIAKSTSRKFQHYLLVRTVMSLATGLCVYGVALLFHLELALEWGVLAFVLNYLPFIGTLVATILPAVLAGVQFGAPMPALGVMLAMILTQNLIGTYVEPRVAGNALAISPFVILLAVFFWSFLWGIAGAFIGVPIAIAIMEACGAYPRTRWVAALLAAASPDPVPRRTPEES